MRRFIPLVALATAAIPAASFADTTQVFNVNANFIDFDQSGNYDPGGSLTGTLTIDLTAGTIIGSDLTAVNGGPSVTFTGAPVTQVLDSYIPPPYDTYDSADSYNARFTNGSDYLQLNLGDVYTPQGLTVYGGGPICALNGVDNCSPTGILDYSYFDANLIADGSVTPAGAPITTTPEPATLFLLGTGVLGMAGAARRRWRV